jgi:hypothetical protein
MCAVLAPLSIFLAMVAVTASPASASSATQCAAVRYSHVIVLSPGGVRLGSRNLVTGPYAVSHSAGAGYSAYYLPAGPSRTLAFAAEPLVCLTATATTTALSVSSLAALKTAASKGPYRFYGLVLNGQGRVTRIDQLPAAAINGEWEGTYVCSQGVTGLDLLIEAGPGGKLTATFDFYPVLANQSVPSGSFVMKGHYDAKGVWLDPGKWLVEPAGYVTVAITGHVPAISAFHGAVTGCSGFTLTRLAARPDEAAVAGKWKGTYVCAQGLTGLTLTIKTGKVVDTMHTLTARFDFYAVASNPGVPTGSFSMAGYYFPGGIDLQPHQWIQQPAGYEMVAIDAVPPAKTSKKLVGAVVGCSSIDLTRS